MGTVLSLGVGDCSESWVQLASANSKSLVLYVQILTKRMAVAPGNSNNSTRTKNSKHLKPNKFIIFYMGMETKELGLILLLQQPKQGIAVERS